MSESNILRCQDLPTEVVDATGVESGQAGAPDASNFLQAYQSGEPFKDIVKRQTQAVEREIIERALAQNDGNITKTAEKLGLSRKGLQLKLKELGIATR
jgi:DNA-binding NtrC family response regulator